MSIRKMVLIVVGFNDDEQLKRLLRFMDKHSFKVIAVSDVEEVKQLTKEEFEALIDVVKEVNVA